MPVDDCVCGFIGGSCPRLNATMLAEQHVPVSAERFCAQDVELGLHPALLDPTQVIDLRHKEMVMPDAMTERSDTSLVEPS